MIPAAPQTFLVEVYLYEDRLKTLRHPIIGWRAGLNDPIGGPAIPVLLINSHTLPGTSYYGIMFENGEIYDTDPAMAGIVDDFDTWLRENVEPAMLKSSPAEKSVKKREAESQTTRESATPSKARATSSPILMTPEQEAATDADMAKLEAQARETMARLHKDGVIQGAPPEPAPAPKRKPRRTKHVPLDAKDLI